RMADPAPARLGHRLQSARIVALTRRAKYLVFHLERGAERSALLIHLRMSGRIEPRPSNAQPSKHVHFVIRLVGGPDLHFDDARKFGRVLWTDDLDSATASLGLEPLDPAFTSEVLAGLLSKRSRQLKPALLDQSLIAGLG